jgi:hypothetical protein
MEQNGVLCLGVIPLVAPDREKYTTFICSMSAE